MDSLRTDGYQSPVGDTHRFPREIAPSPWHISLSFAIWYNLLGTQVSIHTGTDVSMEPGGGLGQPVYATANGVVTYAKDVTGSSWRNLLVIEHTDPEGTIRCSRYGHLLCFGPGMVKGATVVRGQVVGLEGNASGLFYPHLHFDIGKGTLLVNTPTNWPGDNYSFVVKNYYDPERIIREVYPVVSSNNEQAIELLRQAINLLSNPDPDPEPQPDPEPLPVPATVINQIGANIRLSPTIYSTILVEVSVGTKLTVKDSGVDKDNHRWMQVVSGPEKAVGGYVAKDLLSFP